MSGTLADRQHYDAIVVGGGPVGCVASLHLARAGLHVGLIEESEYPYPRAVMFDAYSCAILAEILGDHFERISLKRTPRAGYYLDKDRLGEPFAQTALEVGDTRNWFVQPQVKGVLREVIGATDGIDTFYGWSACKLYTDEVAQLTIEELTSDDILELQSPERIREPIAPFSDPDHTELLRHTVYKFNSLIANRWRFGNVFLCGDAAHPTSPFLGQGLNMGIRNTRNLCQKIELVAVGADPRPFSPCCIPSGPRSSPMGRSHRANSTGSNRCPPPSVPTCTPSSTARERSHRGQRS